MERYTLITAKDAKGELQDIRESFSGSKPLNQEFADKIYRHLEEVNRQTLRNDSLKDLQAKIRTTIEIL